MTNVFCTRSLQQSDIDKALARGIQITAKSFIEITPVLSKELKANIFTQLNKPDLTLLFTSKHAVSIAFDNYLNNIDENMASTWKCYCLSGATKKKLLQYVQPEQIIADADEAGALIKKISISKYTQPIHFFCGNRRRPTLPDFMNKNNIAFNEWTIYKTKNTTHQIEDHFHAYLFYSPSAVESFFEKNILPENIPCFAIGNTTASVIAQRTTNPVFISQKPDTDHLLKALFHYFKIEK